MMLSVVLLLSTPTLVADETPPASPFTALFLGGGASLVGAVAVAGPGFLFGSDLERGELGTAWRHAAEYEHSDDVLMAAWFPMIAYSTGGASIAGGFATASSVDVLVFLLPAFISGGFAAAAVPLGIQSANWAQSKDVGLGVTFVGIAAGVVVGTAAAFALDEES
jgi:hypothetical protein